MVGGTTIGSYQLIERIGGGGMGEVWLARHNLLGRNAAIKLLRPHMSSSPELLDRFFNEAKATTAIADPGIVQIFDFGMHEGVTAYIVMELLEGETLEARRRKRRIPVDDALRLLGQVASSLAAAHARGIIHRDLKPDNIFVVADPVVPGGERAKILDFGIAKLVGDTRVSTQTAVVMGTPEFMSPEQCRGAGKVDARSDVYALGCVLFTMIAGRPPFQAEGGGEVIAMHLREAPPRLGSVASVPRVVDELVAKCLEKDPARRYADGAELASALAGARNAVGSAPTLAPEIAPTLPPTIAPRPAMTTLSAGSSVITPTMRTRPRYVGIAIGAGAVLVAALVIVMATRGEDEAATPAPAARPEPSAPATKPAEAPAKPADKPAEPVAKVDSGEQTKLRILRAIAAFTEWSSTHRGAACPTLADLAADRDVAELADPWGHSLVVTCTDQPADQIIGVISHGPDGKPGTDDDVVSWTLGRDVTSLVRGQRWKTVAVRSKPPRTGSTRKSTTPAVDDDGIPRTRK